MRVGIYADDLTGALDAAAPFAATGRPTYVSVSGAMPYATSARYSVLSLNIDTRHADRFPVFDRAARAVVDLRAAGYELIVNKIDSTLRGHAGLEARAGLSPEPANPLEVSAGGEWRGPRVALIAPAFPAMGRVVRNGRVWVDGLPLAESEAGSDLLSPVLSSDPVEIVEVNTAARPALLSLDDVRSPYRLALAISKMTLTPPSVAVCEGETNADMDAIAREVLRSPQGVIVAGSAGIASALARAMGNVPGEHRTRATPRRRAGPVLFVCGSQRSVSRRQLARAAAERGMAWQQLEPRLLLDTDAAAPARNEAVGKTAQVLETDGRAAISLAGVEPGRAEEPDAHRRLAGGLAAISYRVVLRGKPGTVVLIGGDTASAVLRAVGAAGIVLEGEPMPGIPVGAIDGGLLDGVSVVTKAGAFGDDDALVGVIDYLSGAGLPQSG